jgi:16S rRNA (cytosine1407-C5)-methyltransferase
MIGSVDRILPAPAPALVSDGEQGFHPQVRHAVRLWPHLYDTAGFFAALIHKRESIDAQPSDPPARPLESAGFERMNRQEEARVHDRISRSFGFALEVVAEGQALTLWARDGAVYAIPQRFIDRFADLPCVATGMRLGEWDTEDFVPSHELVARFSERFTGRRLVLSGEQSKVWLAGREMRGMETDYATGTVILLEGERGRFLGLGKVLPNRIRNLLPRRLVY